jgi:hypothetical protein
MKKIFSCVFILISFSCVYGQRKGVTLNDLITQSEIEAHLSFLASDEMRGRNAGSPELAIAANYIRTFFKIQGLKTVPGAENYFQAVEQVRNLPPTVAEGQIDDQHFTLKDNLLVMEGDSAQWSGEMIYVGYGSIEDLSRHDLKGKMVLALAGARDADSFQKVFTAGREKLKALKQVGALGLIEILALPQAPWPALVNYLSQPMWGIKNEGRIIPHILVRPADLGTIKFENGQIVKGSFLIKGKKQISVPGKNVVGLIEGTDAKLKDEYIIVTAHYDHIGVQKSKDNPDSIFNGARDNAIGTVALLQTAKFLIRNPPKHSVLIVALTSEEKGLLGSQWYTEHPLIPLNKHILSINCDGVGYNDKSIVTSISWGRTSTDETITKAAKNFGLNVGGDPDPREGFYERSDQVSFARKGIPAIKLQPGLARMDDEIRKYYHRQADEVSTLDFEYLTRFYKTFIYAVQLLANETKRPTWNAGDKYEEISKKLYGL